MIISAFPACGKTYAFDKMKNIKGLNVLDSDSSKFSWMYITDEEYEFKNRGKHDYKERKIKVRNPEFPNNYIEHIKENIGKVDIIFVSSHKVVRDALSESGLRWSLVIPKKECLTSWVGRAYMRGSSDGFIKIMIDNWLDEIEEDKMNDLHVDMVCYLNHNDFISDREHVWSTVRN